VIDCKPLQAIACGHSPLTNPELASIFENIVDNTGQLLDHDWNPPQPWADPIIWRPRDKNVTADYLANYTMDIGSSWYKCFDWPFPGWSFNDCNFVVHSDGGTRRAQCSSSAWVIDVGRFADGSWQFRRFAMGGTYSAAPLSSFTAESLALAECALCLRRVIASNSNNTIYEPLGKRRRV